MIRLVRRILVAAVLAAAVASAVLAVSLPARGRTLVTWTAPHGRPTGVVLVIHGGAWRASGPRTVALMDARARTFAGWGWAAAVVDYRAFADSPGDVVRAYDTARERYPSLPICAYGESAGGHLALMLAVRRPLRCVIDAAGPVDLPRLGGTPQADWVRAKALAAFGDLRDASPTDSRRRHPRARARGLRRRRPDRPGQPGALPAARPARRARRRAGRRRRPALRPRQRPARGAARVVGRRPRPASARRAAAQVLRRRPSAGRPRAGGDELETAALEPRGPGDAEEAAVGQRQPRADVRPQRAHDALATSGGRVGSSARSAAVDLVRVGDARLVLLAAAGARRARDQQVAAERLEAAESVP